MASVFFLEVIMKTSIIPIFIPHIGCLHRCVFCNQWRITGHHGIPSAEDVTSLIQDYTNHVQERRHWEVAFYGGSFTAIPVKLQERLLKPAYQALLSGTINGIRCSTRPDCITLDILDRLRFYGMSIVELGVQSMDDTVLQFSKRGHTAEQVLKATQLLKAGGFTVGHQLMPGLPGEDWPSLKETTLKICEAKPDIARIYPVAVIENTELAQMYRQGTYTPLSIHEGVCRAAYMKQAFIEHGISCIRTGLQATTDLDDDTQVLAGAYTPAMGEMVDTKRYQIQLFNLLDQVSGGSVIISYHRSDTSRVRGYRNVTRKRAAFRYKQPISWCENQRIQPGNILVKTALKIYNLDINANKIYKV
jgi:histone acetyltransferase (RNA polymerase elongator complex component)